jgi:hypothetical protein
MYPVIPEGNRPISALTEAAQRMGISGVAILAEPARSKARQRPDPLIWGPDKCMPLLGGTRAKGDNKTAYRAAKISTLD